MTQPHKPIAQVESFFCNILLTIGSFYRNIKYHQTGLEGKNKQVNGILRGTAYNFTSSLTTKSYTLHSDDTFRIAPNYYSSQNIHQLIL